MKKPSVKERAMLATGGELPPRTPPTPDEALLKPKTAPGSMMAFISNKSDVHARNIKLEEQLASFQDSSPTRRLDPKLIVRSKWANRHEQSFSDSEFISLKAEIESSGGNVQAIKVRPLVGQAGKFEIVFGHRRHQACLELGIPVLAMISDVSESDLFTEMDRENRERKDLRPYEQGLMYMRALDEGLFPSARKMAASLGVDHGNLSKSLALARLPAEVLSAFSSPLDILLRWAPDLNRALTENGVAVLERAKTIQKDVPRPAPKLVLAYLVGGVVPNNPPPIRKVAVAGPSGESGSLRLNAKGRSAVVSLKNMEPARLDELEKVIKAFLS